MYAKDKRKTPDQMRQIDGSDRGRGRDRDRDRDSGRDRSRDRDGDRDRDRDRDRDDDRDRDRDRDADEHHDKVINFGNTIPKASFNFSRFVLFCFCVHRMTVKVMTRTMSRRSRALMRETALLSMKMMARC